MLALRSIGSRLIVQSLDDLGKLIHVDLLLVLLSRHNHFLNPDQVIDSLCEEFVCRLAIMNWLLKCELFPLIFNYGLQANNLFGLLFGLNDFLLKLLDVLLATLSTVGGGDSIFC